MAHPPRDRSSPQAHGEHRTGAGAPTIRIGPYELGPSLGSGGRGAVYRARHPKLSIALVLKVYRFSNRRDAEAATRKLLHARKLEHPNLGRFIECGTKDGKFFVVSEFLDGVSLDHCLERHGLLSTPIAVEIARQCAWALQGLVERDLIHGALHPGNIFLLPDGRVKVVDYGIVRSPRTETAEDHRYAAHSAPEGADPSTHSIRGDIYCLGSILHQMLTGHPPPRAESSAHRAPVSVCESLAALKPDVDRAILDCLEKMTADDPTKRPAQPATIVDDLTPLERGRGFEDLLAEPDAAEGKPSVSFLPPSPQSFAAHPTDTPVPLPDRRTEPPPAESATPSARAVADTPPADIDITQPIPHLSREGGRAPQNLRGRKAQPRRSFRRFAEPVVAVLLVSVAVATATLWWTSREQTALRPADEPGLIPTEAIPELAVEQALDAEEEPSPVMGGGPERPAPVTPPWNGDLLPLVELPQDTIAGTWRWNEEDLLQNEAGRWSRLELPLSPRGDYDVTVEFVPLEGRGEIFVIFPVGKFWARWSMWCGDLWHMGFNWDDALYSEDNPTWTIAREAMRLGKAYEVRLEVRSHEVSAFMGGNLLRRWKTDFEQLVPATFVSLPDPQRLGIGSDQVAVLFRKAYVKEH